MDIENIFEILLTYYNSEHIENNLKILNIVNKLLNFQKIKKVLKKIINNHKLLRTLFTDFLKINKNNNNKEDLNNDYNYMLNIIMLEIINKKYIKFKLNNNLKNFTCSYTINNKITDDYIFNELNIYTDAIKIENDIRNILEVKDIIITLLLNDYKENYKEILHNKQILLAYINKKGINNTNITPKKLKKDIKNSSSKLKQRTIIQNEAERTSIDLINSQIKDDLKKNIKIAQLEDLLITKNKQIEEIKLTYENKFKLKKSKLKKENLELLNKISTLQEENNALKFENFTLSSNLKHIKSTITNDDIEKIKQKIIELEKTNKTLLNFIRKNKNPSSTTIMHNYSNNKDNTMTKKISLNNFVNIININTNSDKKKSFITTVNNNKKEDNSSNIIDNNDDFTIEYEFINNDKHKEKKTKGIAFTLRKKRDIYIIKNIELHSDSDFNNINQRSGQFGNTIVNNQKELVLKYVLNIKCMSEISEVSFFFKYKYINNFGDDGYIDANTGKIQLKLFNDLLFFKKFNVEQFYKRTKKKKEFYENKITLNSIFSYESLKEKYNNIILLGDGKFGGVFVLLSFEYCVEYELFMEDNHEKIRIKLYGNEANKLYIIYNTFVKYINNSL